jgi:hypothetical protein
MPQPPATKVMSDPAVLAGADENGTACAVNRFADPSSRPLARIEAIAFDIGTFLFAVLP